MKNTFSVSTQAAQDVKEQARRIEADNPDAALRFVGAFERACDLLANHPEMAPVHDYGWHKLSSLRMWPIRGFEKHLIFYRLADQGIEVARVLYASRDVEAVLLGKPTRGTDE
jgi:toxin ParE1/3/4